MSTEHYTPDENTVKSAWSEFLYLQSHGMKHVDDSGAEFDRFIARIREDARAGALIRGAEIGWDAAVGAMQFKDGTRPDFVEVVNPYKKKEN